MMHEELVILVNEHDKEIGLMPKLEAHKTGSLHRAFSVFIFNAQGEILLQQRALHKYHSAGLWSNTCCSHPRQGEPCLIAAQRRLNEEMGLNTKLKYVSSFIYKETLENGLIEHEFDHIFVGHSEEIPTINYDEVLAWKYISASDLLHEIEKQPELYTIWLKIALPMLLKEQVR